MAAASPTPSGRWSAHPWGARCLRALVYTLPVAGSLGFVRLATAVTGVPTGSLWIFLGWWLAISLTATGIVSAIYAVTRRLLPLGALLGLSLVFPDEAPSRFTLALGSGTVESLEDRLRLMREAGEAPSAQEAAEILIRLAAALDIHDRITRGHAERVRAYSYSLGKQLNLAGDELDRLNWAALLHDIGKLEVSTDILNKPGKPTDEEWQTLRLHPLYGERLVEPLREWLGDWIEAVGYHHERWDGKGYPREVAGAEIPIAGRIVAIADVFDVITSARSYKKAASASQARAEIARCSGTQFDPHLVRAFVNISLGRMRLVMGPVSWLTHAPLLARLPLTPSITAAFGGFAALATAAVTGIVPAHDTARAASYVRKAAPAAVTPRPPRDRDATRAPLVHPGRRSSAPLDVETAVEPALEPQPAATESTIPTPASSPAAPAEVVAPTPPARPPAPEAPDPAPGPAPDVPAPPATTTPSDPPPASTPAPEAPRPTAPRINSAPTFTAGPDEIVLEDAGPQTIAAWATAISPGGVDESGQHVTFTITVDHPALFATQPAVTPDGTLSFTPAADANGIATVTVTAVDDGGTADGGHDTGTPQAFTLTIVPVNDAPSFTAGPNQTTLEDAGPQTISGWAAAVSAGPATESSQNVAFTVTADDPALFAAQPAVAPDGTLTYTPAAEANGVATVTVTAADDGGTVNGGHDTGSPQTFTITVVAVNDAPSFTAGPNQTVLAVLGAQSVPGWATAISAGPADESWQSISFTVTVDNPALFASPPAVAPDGTLTYTPALLAVGVATVTVRAVDNGGSANSGIDTSAPRTFTITLL